MSSGQLIALPRSLDRWGTEDLKTRAIDIAENKEHAFVKADARSPDSPTVNVPAFQAIGWSQIEFVGAIAREFPIHQVLGMQDLDRRIHVHGGAGQIIVLADADDIRVFKFPVKQRIGVRAVAVVGSPVSGRRRWKPG